MKSKKILAVIGALFIALSGCTSVPSGNGNNVEKSNQYSSDDSDISDDLNIGLPFENKKPTGADISEGRLPNYLMVNNLTISHYNKKAGCESLFISGLKNEKIQQSINNTIDLYAQKLSEKLPSEIIGNTSGFISDDKISAIETVNYNNIFSFYLSRNIEYILYRNDTETSSTRKYFSEAIYLNFDLNTGEQLNLADVFVDGFDYVDFINTKIYEKLDFDGPDFKSENYLDNYLAEPFDSLYPRGSFTGLENEPSFLISEDGLRLIIDKNSPEFINLSENDQIIQIPFYEIGDNLAIFDRFNSKGRSIYSDIRTSNMVLFSPLSDNIGDYEVRQIPFEDIDLISKWEYPTYLSDSFLNIIKNDVVIYAQNFSADDSPNYMTDIYAQGYGRYVTYNIYTMPRTCRVYEIDGNKFHEIKLKDIFMPDFDWQSALYNLIIKKYSQDEYPEVATMENFRSLLNNNLKYFGLDSDDMYLCFSYYDSQYSISEFYVSYADLGCDNLTIFHD